uniref:dispanin subfamily A member 2b-like n=1 Tax=Euleptes europaea TaxID=460621 RepID=UPI00253FECD7|nr:dispanin subfamily A member 2b-like [Euleptes europaea]
MQPAPQPLSLQPYDMKEQGGPAPPYPYPYPRGAAAAPSPSRQPRDFVVWSLFNFIFLNVCCLGFVALVFSFKSRDRKVVGDAEAAASYGTTAKSLNIAALVLSILFLILIIVLVASGTLALQHMYQLNKDNRMTYEDYFQKNGK